MLTQTYKTVLRTLVSVMEEATPEPTDWALIGSGSLQLQGLNTQYDTIEFMTTDKIVTTIGKMLGEEPDHISSAVVSGTRLQLTREDISIFVMGDPVFEGAGERFSPVQIPSLWNALNHGSLDGHRIPCTPPEWELVLAVILQANERVEEIQQYLSEFGYDSRLLVRILREGHATTPTENMVWSLLEERI